MQTEWKYVVGEFDKNFSNRADKKIVLYGVGKHTKAIINELGEKYNFVGLMDAEKAGERLWGYQIFSPEDLKQNEVDFIVIVARPSVHQIIYKRIEKVTQKKGITVYSIAGKEILREEPKMDYDNSYFQYNKQYLKKVIDQCEVVSFDIFDTLIMRKALYPKDVLMMLDEELSYELGFCFLEERINAEQLLKETMHPTLADIYRKMQEQCALSKEQCDELMEKEILKEIELIVPRQEMVEIFNECIEQQKTVILVSDMYLSKEIIERILEKCNIQNYMELIISCEYKKTKQEGLLRELLSFAVPKKILHIGDNEKADIIEAQKLGFKTFKIMSALEMIENSSYCSIMNYSNTLCNRNTIGLIVSDLFNSPFALYGTKGVLKIKTVQQLGNFIAPIILYYLLWVIERQMECNASDILFVARDGYLPIKIYRLLCENARMDGMPEGKYIYTSGRTSSIAAIYEKEDILPLIEEFKGDVVELFQNVFMLDTEKLDIQKGIEDNVLENVEEILQSAKMERESFKVYIEDKKIDFSGNVIYFDIFSKGTGQDNFERILDKKFMGLYMNKTISGIERRNKIEYQSFFEAENHYVKNYNIFKGYSLLEYIFSSPEPCIKRIQEKKPVFYKEDREAEGIEFLNNMQERILSFCKEFCRMNYKNKSVCQENLFADEVLGLLFDKSELVSGVVPALVTYEWFRGAHKIGSIDK